MTRFLRYFFGVVTIAILIVYISSRWEDLKHLVELGPMTIVEVYAVSAVGLLNTGLIMRCLLGVFGIHPGVLEMTLLQNAVYLVNYAPGKMGMVLRASYLKRRYGLSYAEFGAFTMYLALLTMGTASVLSVILLFVVYGMSNTATRLLGTTFLVVAAACIFFAFVPFPCPAPSNKRTEFLNRFLLARDRLNDNKGVLAVCAALFICNFLLTSVRLLIIYHKGLHQDVHPAGFIIMGALGYVTVFLSLTPGGLGVRELVLSAGAAALGIPLDVGILASLIERGFTLGWVLVAGSVSILWISRSFPAKGISTVGSTESPVDMTGLDSP